jgi:replicative DNA helicase
MLAVASLKRSLEFDPVEQGVKRKRAEIKLSPTTFTTNNSPSKQQQQQQSIFTSSTNKTPSLKSSSLSSDDTPMFTYAQTAQMCTRLLREQDKSIREQYEQLLTTKLNEQYEQFIRYSHDSVHKNPSKQKLFHFGQQQDTENSSTIDFSYVS